MVYNHLKGKGFEEGPSGVVIQSANISIPITTGTREYPLEERSSVERNFLVGFWVTAAGAKTGELTTQAAGTIFNGVALNLRVEQTVIAKIYAHQIQKANDQGRPYYVHLPGRVNLSETTIEVNDNAGIAANTVFEFQAEYAQKAL